MIKYSNQSFIPFQVSPELRPQFLAYSIQVELSSDQNRLHAPKHLHKHLSVLAVLYAVTNKIFR